MWYEKFDLSENPFIDNEETELVGYEDIIDEVIYNVISGNITVIEGKEGSGKTTILKKVIEKFRGESKVIYLEGGKIGDPNIENVLINRYGWWGRLTKKMPKGMILLFDETQDISKKNYERIKYFYDQNYIRSVVFTSSDYGSVNFSEGLKDRVKKVIRLKTLKEDDAVEIIENRLKSSRIFSEDVIKDVFNRSKKSPKLFLQNCEKLCEYIVEHNKEKVGEEDVIAVLGKEEKKVKKKPKKEIEEKKEKKEAVKYDEDKEKTSITYEDDVAEKYY